MKIKVSYNFPKLGDLYNVGIDEETLAVTKSHLLTSHVDRYGKLSQREQSNLHVTRFVVGKIAEKFGFELEDMSFEVRQKRMKWIEDHYISLYFRFKKSSTGYIVEKEDYPVLNPEDKDCYFEFINNLIKTFQQALEDYKNRTTYEEREIDIGDYNG